MELILASTSPFRRELLSRLGIPFRCVSPEVDETAKEKEPADQLVARLARLKAEAVAARVSGALVIGSDQVAELNGQIFGKPHTHENALRQLRLASGNTVQFHTGLCVMDTTSGVQQILVEPFEVTFRPLTEQQIEQYLLREQPYQCAGSFKSEGLGICLFEKMQGRDPNSLIGLPLMGLVDLLARFGVDPLTQ
ncbi:Maf family protein [Aliiglaciecola sp. CAU 1673]|uniref:Maf family protein n=1 Tax=Aliiglaciecola sp. CAU 1673 TaxID=3032595 RepID=UPI0023DC3F7C|nr:Maf family protein [Aliiglaciecola sp. CAU 1673]MDF2177646.1 Maf family protein [Aliiglaciecola sp. CAU 1673]